jgi:hypothetical protein
MQPGTAAFVPGGDVELPNNLQYSSMIGVLLYLSMCTRLEICYCASALARFTAKPLVAHWQACKRVLAFLVQHPDLGITFTHSASLGLTAYSDASFAEDPLDRRSQTGMVIMASGGAVSWQSKRQVTCAVSTSESEYQAMSTAAKEVQWLKQLREDLGHDADMVVLYGDNTGALSWTTDWKLEPRAKHIDVMHHYVRELVLSKRLEVKYVNTTLQLADIFTKPLPAELFWRFLELLGVTTK